MTPLSTESHCSPAELIVSLCSIVGDRGLLQGDAMTAYLHGARYGDGRAICVVRPSTTEEVSAVVALCVNEGVRVIPQGANTGLVGASTPDATGRQVVLSLNRLRHRCDIDAANRTATVDAGVLLHELNDKLEPYGLWFPVDLAADPSIGGMVSSNTGGTRLLRYGDVRHNLLAIEAVLFDPPGEVVHFGKRLRKDNTGYDLKQLFVGTSGSAGIITAATLEVREKPKQTATALIVPASDAAVSMLLSAAESQLGEFLCAFEGLSSSSIHAALKHVPSLRNPFGPEPIPEFVLLIELASCASPVYTGFDISDVLSRFLEDHLDHDITNAVLGRGNELWELRHALSEGARALGRIIGLDISVPRSDVMRFRRQALELVARHYPQLQVVDFGHIGDGGLHFNLVWPRETAVAYSEEIVCRLRDDIYDLVVSGFQGSFSAEHGIGAHNFAYYRKFTQLSALRLAGDLQRLLDPRQLCGAVRFSAPEDQVLGT